MPFYNVECLEKFVVRTFYYVQAKSPDEAEKLIREGNVGYEDKEIEEGDEEFISVEMIEEVSDPSNADEYDDGDDDTDDTDDADADLEPDDE